MGHLLLLLCIAINFFNGIFILDIFVFLLIFLSFIPGCSYLETVRLSWASFYSFVRSTRTAFSLGPVLPLLWRQTLLSTLPELTYAVRFSTPAGGNRNYS